MKIPKSNLIIYGIALVVSIILIGLFFINYENPFCIISGSIGASGVGAVFLAGFIENSNNHIQEKLKKNKRQSIIEPVVRSIVEIVYIEWSLIEKENKEKTKKLEGKSLRDIAYAIEEYYFSEKGFSDSKDGYNELFQKFDLFNSRNQKKFEIRKKIYKMGLGGLTGYAINDIINNRSFNLSEQLFSDKEIKELAMIQMYYGKISSTENYYEYIDNFINLISWLDLGDNEKSTFFELGTLTWKEGELYDSNNKQVKLMHKHWVENYEI